jgi:uncharacterized FlaG/YvyC family protein
VNMDVQAIDPGQIAAAAPAPPAGGTYPVQPANGTHAEAHAATPHSDAPTQKPRASDETLHRALSHLVGGGSNVSVQFRVVHAPNEIVTVFKNADTGEVISEFPAQSMVLIAQFFNKLAGAVLDRTA